MVEWTTDSSYVLVRAMEGEDVLALLHEGRQEGRWEGRFRGTWGENLKLSVSVPTSNFFQERLPYLRVRPAQRVQRDSPPAYRDW